MKSRTAAILLLATLLSGCFSFNHRPPAQLFVPIENVVQRAQNGNWLLRVHTDSVYEGRVQSMYRGIARIGRRDVVLANVTRIERAYEADAGGRNAGTVVGIGIGGLFVATLLSFIYSMGESPSACNAICFVGVAAMGATIGTIGTIAGSLADPPERAWATIWQR